MKKTSAGVMLLISIFFFYKPLFSAGIGTSADEKNIENPFSFSSSFEVFYFFSQDIEAQSGVEYDFTGRENRMHYQVEPVYMASFDASYSWNFLTFGSTYKTNRVIKGGGDISSQFTDDERLSEILKLSLRVYNFQTSFRTIRFDFGRALVYNDASGELVDEKELNLRIREYNISYLAEGVFPEYSMKGTRTDLVFGYKYLSYTLPRIIYTLEEDSGTTGDEKKFVYADESSVQNVPLDLHMGGFGFYLHGENPGRFDLGFLCAAYIGGGESRLTLLREGKRNKYGILATYFEVSPSAACILSKGPVSSKLFLAYDLEMILVNPIASEKGVQTFGKTESIHGLQAGAEIRF